MKRKAIRHQKKKAVQEYKEGNGLSSRELNRNLLQFGEKTSVNSKFDLATRKDEDIVNEEILDATMNGAEVNLEETVDSNEDIIDTTCNAGETNGN